MEIFVDVSVSVKVKSILIIVWFKVCINFIFWFILCCGENNGIFEWVCLYFDCFENNFYDVGVGVSIVSFKFIF